jgi:hypothetical protein
MDLPSMQLLPRPNELQVGEFVQHLLGAHSWYKHLSIVNRAQFVLFLAPDAGGGFESTERLHYSWKTTDEYRRRFGLLDFAWRLPDENDWSRDAGAPVRPSTELVNLAGFTLGPFCSDDFNAIEVICSLWGPDAQASPTGWWDEDVAQLSAETRAQLKNLDELRIRSDMAYSGLDETTRQAIASKDMGYELTPLEETTLTSPSAMAYRNERDSLLRLYESLRAPEVHRVQTAVRRLLDTLA